MLTPEELEKEWTAQSAISDYTNWLQAQVIKLRRQIADKIKQRAAACAQIEKSERRADAAEAEVARLREALQEIADTPIEVFVAGDRFAEGEEWGINTCRKAALAALAKEGK